MEDNLQRIVDWVTSAIGILAALAAALPDGWVPGWLSAILSPGFEAALNELLVAALALIALFYNTSNKVALGARKAIQASGSAVALSALPSKTAMLNPFKRIKVA